MLCVVYKSGFGSLSPLIHRTLSMVTVTTTPNNLHEQISGITFTQIICAIRYCPLCRSHTKGYLTEESGHSSILSSMRSGRPLGPLASAKAKQRPSRSAQRHNPNLPSNALCRSNSTSSSQHQSRQMYKTPAANRLQTMSAERGMAAVTPKMVPNMPVSLLRYQRMGETVISMAGSPVIAQG